LFEEMEFHEKGRVLYARTGEREREREREKESVGPALSGKCNVAINLDLSNGFGAIEDDEFGSCLRL
jgi:hypothetical protein